MEDRFLPSSDSLHDCCIFDKHVEAAGFSSFLFDMNVNVPRLLSHPFLRHYFVSEENRIIIIL